MDSKLNFCYFPMRNQGPKNHLGKDIFWHLSITFILFLIYLSSIASTPNTYDSGIFQFTGEVLGTVHPTGYPAYIIMNFIFIHLFPLGTLAWKANFLSAIFAIIALNYLFRFMISLGIHRFFSFIATLILGSTRELWIISVTAEVYSLNLMFFSIVLHLLYRWNQEKHDKYLYLAVAIYAFSFGNHLTTLTLLPGFIYVIYITDKKAFRDIKKIIWALFFIIIGASQYLYLFYRYYDSSARFLEGMTPDFKSLFNYVTGAHWKSEMFGFSLIEIVIKRLPNFINNVITNFYYLPVILAIIGALKFKRKRIHAFFGLSLGGIIIFALNYNIPDIKSYYLPFYFIISIYMAAGMHFLADRYSRRENTLRKIRVGYLLLPVVFMITNYHYVNKTYLPKNKQIALEVNAALNIVGKNAVIASPGYKYSPVFWYYLLGEDLEKKNNIYLIHHFNPDEIYNYLTKNTPIYLNEERRVIPDHLDVYVFGPDLRSEIHKTGLKTTLIADNLFKVSEGNH